MKKFILFAFGILPAVSAAQIEFPKGVLEEPPSRPEVEIQEVPRPLRKRQHIVSLKYTSTNSSLSASTTATKVKSDSKSGSLGVSYGQEFGRMQPVVELASSVSESGSSESSEGSISFGGRFSFIENRPGNDLVPFAKLMLGNLNGRAMSGAVKIDYDGKFSILSVGLDWYPFGELFAFTLEYASIGVDLSGSVQGTSISGNMNGTGLMVGYILSF